MKIIYTETAKQELEKFEHRQVEYLEEILKGKKYVFGDEVVEITASDVREAADQIRPIQTTRKRLSAVQLASTVYFFAGILMAVGGVFYPQIQDMFDKNPKQIIFIIAGISLSLISYFMTRIFKQRAERMEELEREYERYRKVAKPEYRQK